MVLAEIIENLDPEDRNNIAIESFARVMANREYGRPETRRAWYWYRTGFEDGLIRLTES